MKKIIFIGGILPEDRINDILNNSKTNLDFAAHNFQRKIIKGLDSMGYDYEVISLPFISSYPKHYKKIKIDFNRTNKIKFLSFCNLPYIKIISRYFSLKKYLKKLSENNKEKELVFLMYSLHFPFLKNAKLIKKIFSNSKITLIVPDLQEYMSDNQSIIYKTFKKIEIKLSNKCYYFIDSFVFLTKHMNERINYHNKPYVVVEGISEINNSNDITNTFKEKYFLYSGTLAERYGIKNLVDAFCMLKDYNIKLYICGKGNMEWYVKKCCSEYDNIKYLGLLSPEKVKDIQKNAFALINPRQNNEEYTKYSFPSKIMEYVSTGKPTICYKLDGIPDEYDNILIFPMDNSIESLSQCIVDVSNYNEKQMNEIYLKSRNIMLEKSPRNTIIKIFRMIEKELK